MRKIILLLFFLPLICLAQNWNQVSNFPGDGRHHPITFSNSDYGFVISGSYLNDSYKYDKLNDTWVQLQDFPSIGRGYAYGISNGNKAYVGFGSTDNGTYPTDWWEYDMLNDVWTQKNSFPGDGRNHPAMVLVNDKIYMGCGSNGNGNLGDWWEYDIANDTWNQKTDFIGNDRHHPFYFGIGDYAYVGFGHGTIFGPGSNPSANAYIYHDFYRYDPFTDSWTQMSNFPGEARVAGTQFSYNGKGYVLSGDGDDHGPLSVGEFWEYDPLLDTWVQLTSHPGDAIWAPGSFVIDCNVYFLLGQDNNTVFPTTPIAVYTYQLSEDCGCTDSTAYNYSNLATINDGSCCYFAGCMDALSINYDSLACYDDGTCIPAVLGCLNLFSTNYNPLANVDIFNGGAIDIDIGSGDYFNNNQYLIFDSNEECIIKSADIYAENPNTITFELRDDNGLVIDDTTYTVSAGKQKVILNFEVPVAANLQLGVSANNSGLYRNSTGATYPYDIGGMINITGSSAQSAGYYYFYYNIEVEAICLPSIPTIINEYDYSKELYHIIDITGKESIPVNNLPLIYIYKDGTIKRQIVLE